MDVFEAADWLDIQAQAVVLQPYLRNALDLVERQGGAVCIDAGALKMAIYKQCVENEAFKRFA